MGDATSYGNKYNGNSYGGNVYGASRGANDEEQAKQETGKDYSTVLYTQVNINTGAKVLGDVFGGGEAGDVGGSVEVNMLGGEIGHDIYGGGALASTNKFATTQNSVTTYPNTTMNLNGGKVRNVYGGGLGRLKFETLNNVPQPKPDVEAKSGNVTIEFNNNLNSVKGFIADRVFGGNNLAGTPLGHIQVHIYATQNPLTDLISKKFVKEDGYSEYTITNYSDLTDLATTLGITESIETDVATLQGDGTDEAKNTALSNIVTAIKNKIDSENSSQGKHINYDVQAVYGGGNLSAYMPTSDSEKAEVIIEGCDATSIYQVYGGGNAAPVSATDLKITGAYEIYEAFGGGNGYDSFTLDVNGTDVTYPNPGANVGYTTYAHFEKDNENNIIAVDNSDADTKEKRQAANSPYKYGTGVASTDIIGGRMHYVYGGSNNKGNIRTTALSVYEDASLCETKIDETYGGGKNAEIDGDINLELDCIKNMDRIYGGARDANINSNVTVNITNGTFKQVFGGNNTSGTINGAITVNVYEDGCQPIHIDELYGGGYLAPYSIYGYENGQPRTKDQYDQLTDEQKAAAGVSKPHNDPRINIISATEIGTIYGGGYQALVIGNPHVNVNMEEGKVKKKYMDRLVGGGTFVGPHIVNGKVYYTGKGLDDDDNGILAIGTIDTIFGGGNLAKIYGDTYVEIGTGRWVTSWDANGNPIYETEVEGGDKYIYKVKTPAVYYDEDDCDNNATLPGAISTET